MYPFMWPVEKGADTFVGWPAQMMKLYLARQEVIFLTAENAEPLSLQLMTQRRNSGQSVMS